MSIKTTASSCYQAYFVLSGCFCDCSASAKAHMAPIFTCSFCTCFISKERIGGIKLTKIELFSFIVHSFFNCFCKRVLWFHMVSTSLTTLSLFPHIILQHSAPRHGRLMSITMRRMGERLQCSRPAIKAVQAIEKARLDTNEKDFQ